MAYNETNSGTLFRNQRMKNDRSPTHTGKLNVDGTWYWISAWVKEAGPNAKNPGSKFFSLSITEMEEQPKAQQPAGYDGDLDEDIPFSLAS